MQDVLKIAAGLLTVYVMARLIFMAYYAERSAHIQLILKMAKENRRHNG